MRLTRKDGMGDVYIKGHPQNCKFICSQYYFKTCEKCPLGKALTELAAFEDTGLTPAEVAELAKAKDEKG